MDSFVLMLHIAIINGNNGVIHKKYLVEKQQKH
jgi:hypothetical protein